MGAQGLLSPKPLLMDILHSVSQLSGIPCGHLQAWEVALGGPAQGDSVLCSPSTVKWGFSRA